MLVFKKVGLFLAVVLWCFSSTLMAQSFPNRPVKIVVPFPAGGSVDTLARVVGQYLSKKWTQSVIIENKPGGGTVIAGAMVAKAAQQVAMHYGTEYVAVVSYHDMRAGAWSQTQMLCAQMGVDCFRASSPETLQLLINELSTRRLILIDTPGVQMNERLSEILQVCPQVGLHAVVPADSSSVTLSRILLKSQLPWKSIMMSKLDEANSPWPLIQFLIAEGAHCVVSAGGGSDKIADGLKSSGLQKLINIAMTQLAPSLDTFGAEMLEVSAKPATLDAPVIEVDHSEPLTHTMGLSRPNWSLEMPQSELHG
jgi:hypothetical protein